MPEKSLLELLPSYVQAAALVTGGIWAYLRFFAQRENEPATDLDIDLIFVGIQDEKWIVEVTVFLKNQSLVQLTYDHFRISLRYLERGDKVQDGGERINYQLWFEKSIDERLPPDTEGRYFSNTAYINPKQEFKHRYITSVPMNATFVWVQCKFDLPNKVKVNSQRIFRVPEVETKNGGGWSG
jgi:hypothetical protein